MNPLSELDTLQKSKHELLAKFYDPTSSYSEYLAVSKQLRDINKRISEIKTKSV